MHDWVETSQHVVTKLRPVFYNIDDAGATRRHRETFSSVAMATPRTLDGGRGSFPPNTTFLLCVTDWEERTFAGCRSSTLCCRLSAVHISFSAFFWHVRKTATQCTGLPFKIVCTRLYCIASVPHYRSFSGWRAPALIECVRAKFRRANRVESQNFGTMRKASDVRTEAYFRLMSHSRKLFLGYNWKDWRQSHFYDDARH